MASHHHRSLYLHPPSRRFRRLSMYFNLCYHLRLPLLFVLVTSIYLPWGAITMLFRISLPPAEPDQSQNLTWFQKQAVGLNSGTFTLVDLSNVSYVINNDLCSGQDVYLLVLVASAASHFLLRQAIRATWGSLTTHRNHTIRLGFLLATAGDEVMLNVVEENLEYGDLIVGSFVDSYVNMTYKHVMALSWAQHWCGVGMNRPRLLLKADDDIYLDMFALLDYLLAVPDRDYQAHIFCHVFLGSRVIRNTRSKWYVAPSIYQESRYPPYCWGPAIIYPKHVLAPILHISSLYPYFWIDDVFVSGVLIKRLSVRSSTPHRNVTTKDKALATIRHKHMLGKFSIFGKEQKKWLKRKDEQQKQKGIGGLVPGKSMENKAHNMRVLWNMTLQDRQTSQ